MLRFASALAAGLMLASLAACVAPGSDGIGGSGDLPPERRSFAPPIPRDDRPKAEFTAMTGINSDAVAAISGNASRAYVYFDLFAADKAALAQAPAKLCGHYGKSLRSSHVAEPEDRVPGMKALVVECNQAPRT